EATVMAFITIITHNKEFVVRNSYGAKVITRAWDFLVAILERGMRVIGFGAVNVDGFMANLDRISGDSDDTLDKVFAAIARIDEYDHIATIRVSPLPHRRFYGIGQPQTVQKFAYQNMIADLQRREHRPGRNFERLHNEAANHKC